MPLPLIIYIVSTLHYSSYKYFLNGYIPISLQSSRVKRHVLHGTRLIIPFNLFANLDNGKPDFKL